MKKRCFFLCQITEMKKPLGAHTERLSTFRPPRVRSVFVAQRNLGVAARCCYFAGVVAPDLWLVAAPAECLAEDLSAL